MNKSKKLNYFSCNKGGLHEGEHLNYICLNKECTERGLVCSICRNTDHIKHEDNVCSLKLFLNSLETHAEQEKIDSFDHYIQQLEKTKTISLYTLRQVVQNIAEQFRELEMQIINNFNKCKEKLLSKVCIQFKLNFESLLKEAQEVGSTPQQKYKANIKQLTDMSEIQSDRKIVIKNDIQSLLKDYQNQSDHYKHIFEEIQQYVKLASKRTTNIKIINPKAAKKRKQKNHDTMMGSMFDSQSQESECQLSPLNYTFSNTIKGSTVKVTQGGKSAQQTVNSPPSRFIMVDQGIGWKNQTIKFKINKLANWIGLGISIRSIIKNKNYEFAYNKIGHGSYLISSNGYRWSHSENSENLTPGAFTFQQGDIVQLTLTPQSLIFKKNMSTEHTLKINLSPNDWKEVCFSCNLTTVGDIVTII